VIYVYYISYLSRGPEPAGEISGLMERLTRKAFADPATQPLYQAIFTHRNHNMTNTLLQLEDGKTCFVTIGAAHMIGNEGIVKLLQKRGFQISQPSF